MAVPEFYLELELHLLLKQFHVMLLPFDHIRSGMQVCHFARYLIRCLIRHASFASSCTILAFLAENGYFGLLLHGVVALWVEPSEFFSYRYRLWVIAICPIRITNETS